jgi:hypothetical protein
VFTACFAANTGTAKAAASINAKRVRRRIDTFIAASVEIFLTRIFRASF